MNWTKESIISITLTLAFIVGAVLLAPRISALLWPHAFEDLKSVTLNGQTIRVTVADTPETRDQGLSGRESIAPDQGMFFVFPEAGYYSFWMKDMLFPIDILWLSYDGRVVYIVENATPESYPNTFTSSDVPARYVLELSAGFVKQYTVNLGDKVYF